METDFDPKVLTTKLNSVDVAMFRGATPNYMPNNFLLLTALVNNKAK